MAACLPQEGDSRDPDKPAASSTSPAWKTAGGGCVGGAAPLSTTSAEIRLEGDKAYDEVARYDEEDLRSLLEEVTNAGKSKKILSPFALALFRKEQDALREESSSGDDTGDLASRRHKKGHRDHSGGDQSAAARTSTGGSLGSLHDLSETKQPKKVAGPNQGVASRCREGGSCGNLSRGSFETQPPRKRKGRKSRDAARASTSQREGGSLQNLSKTEAASNEAKKLHKSGSLSQVCSDVSGGARSKNRRQKTASESSSNKKCYRHFEDRDAGDDSSGTEAAVEQPHHLLAQSPHSTLSTHSAEHPFPPKGVGGAAGCIAPEYTNDIEDSMSDEAAEGDTDDESEPKDSKPMQNLGFHSQGRNCPGKPIEEDGIELQEIISHTADSDLPHAEVDKTINFSLGRGGQDDSSRRTFCLQDNQTLSLKEEKTSNKNTEEDGKRKSVSSGNDNSEPKSFMDENGNMPQQSYSTSLQGFSNGIQRKNGLNTSNKEISRIDRLKARKDKKKANKEKDIVNIVETPGFCGDQDINKILKYLGADSDTTSAKNKKKHKGKREENREERDGPKKKSKNNEKSSDENVSDKCRNEDHSLKASDDNGGDITRDTSRRSKEREDERKSCNNKKNRGDTKKGKKGSGSLRESSSVEDLVSKSKQSDGVRDIRKQVTVDDGDMSLSVINTYHNNNLKVNKFEDLISGANDGKDPLILDATCDNEVDADHTPSEFVADFYSVGDSYSCLGVDISQAPPSPSGGDFEIVSSKKRSKRYKNGSQTVSQSTKNGGSDRWSSGSYTGVYGDENFRTPRFSQNKPNQKVNCGSEKPHINFGEGPRMAHENTCTFFTQWGDRYGNERYAVTTTSAPHSEDSDSDGDDSVHSMPAPSITPRPDVRKPPPSSDSTPQTSYANIAKLAASANRAQMKRMAPTSIHSSSTAVQEMEGEPSVKKCVDLDPKLPVGSESRSNILDDNFPSLAESLCGSGLSSAISSSKCSESRTSNPLPESVVVPLASASANPTQTLDQCKETVTLCETKADQKETIEHMASSGVTNMESQVTNEKKVIAKSTGDGNQNPPLSATSSRSSSVTSQQQQQQSYQAVLQPPNHQHHHHLMQSQQQQQQYHRIKHPNVNVQHKNYQQSRQNSHQYMNHSHHHSSQQNHHQSPSPNHPHHQNRENVKPAQSYPASQPPPSQPQGGVQPPQQIPLKTQPNMNSRPTQPPPPLPPHNNPHNPHPPLYHLPPPPAPLAHNPHPSQMPYPHIYTKPPPTTSGLLPNTQSMLIPPVSQNSHNSHHSQNIQPTLATHNPHPPATHNPHPPTTLSPHPPTTSNPHPPTTPNPHPPSTPNSHLTATPSPHTTATPNPHPTTTPHSHTPAISNPHPPSLTQNLHPPALSQNPRPPSTHQNSPTPPVIQNPHIPPATHNTHNPSVIQSPSVVAQTTHPPPVTQHPHSLVIKDQHNSSAAQNSCISPPTQNKNVASLPSTLNPPPSSVPPNPHSASSTSPPQNTALPQNPSSPSLLGLHPSPSGHSHPDALTCQSVKNSDQAHQVDSVNCTHASDTGDEKPNGSGKLQGKQSKNGSALPSNQSGDTSRMKKIEPAVIFTDHAKFSHSVSGIEFGFGFDEPIVTTTSDNKDEGSGSESVVLDNEDSNCNNNISNNNNNNNSNNMNNNNSIHLKNNHIIDFSKRFKPPKNDKISYNYEELIRLFAKEWEMTLQAMEDDPKNNQYWRAADSTEDA